MIHLLWDFFCYITYSAFHRLEPIFSTDFTVIATCVLVPALLLWRIFGPAYQNAGIRYRPETGWGDGLTGSVPDDGTFGPKGSLYPEKKSTTGGKLKGE